MDLATLLMRVDERRYTTVNSWLADLDLIVAATHQVLATPRCMQCHADINAESAGQRQYAAHDHNPMALTRNERQPSCCCKSKLPCAGMDVAQYWGEDAAGQREVSRAHALADEARSLLRQRIRSDLMLESQRLAARGGLPPAPSGAIRAPLCASTRLLTPVPYAYHLAHVEQGYLR